MANEINVHYEVTGALDFVAVLYTVTGQLVNASTGAAMNDTDANLPNAAIELLDTGHSGHYSNAAAPTLANGTYTVRTWRKTLNGALGALARSDTLVPPVNEGTLQIGATGGGGSGSVGITQKNVGVIAR